MKPIKSRINRIKWLRDGAKSLLIEVCELHEAGKGGCWASNQRLANRLGCDMNTASRRVATLTKAGLLISQVLPEKGNRRILSPSTALRGAYMADTPALIDELTIVKTGDTPNLTIVGNVVDYSQKQQPTIVRNVVDYSLFRGDLSKRREEQERKNRTIVLEGQKQTDDAAIAALSLENKQILERLEKAKEEFKGLRAEVVDLKAKLAAKQNKTGRLHPFADSPYADVQAVANALNGTDYEHADVAYYHETIRNWAEGKGEKKLDWLATIRNAMLKDSREGKLKISPTSTHTPYVDPQRNAATIREREQRLGLVDSRALSDAIALSRSFSAVSASAAAPAHGLAQAGLCRPGEQF